MQHVDKWEDEPPGHRASDLDDADMEHGDRTAGVSRAEAEFHGGEGCLHCERSKAQADAMGKYQWTLP